MATAKMKPFQLSTLLFLSPTYSITKLQKEKKNNQLADWKNEHNDSQLIYRTLDNTKK